MPNSHATSTTHEAGAVESRPVALPYSVGYIVGSPARASSNRRLAIALERLAPPDMKLHEIRIDTLGFYSPDLEAELPEAVTEFKAAIAEADGVLLVTPEYSRSVPGYLKNAIDWASRPQGRNSFDGKPTAVIGTSSGPLGAAIAQQHLKSVLTHLNAPQLGQPEGFIHSAPGLFTDTGEVTKTSTAEFLTSYLVAFHELIALHSSALAR